MFSVLGVGASFSEIFLSVLYDVRYLLAYIFLTGISASLCLGAIYKHDNVRMTPTQEASVLLLGIRRWQTSSTFQWCQECHGFDV